MFLSLLVACGGGKKENTTPKPAGGAPDGSQSMNDTTDPADPGPSGTGGGGAPGGSGTPGGAPVNGGGGGAVDAGGGAPAEPNQPPPEVVITPPNYDVDPQQAKAQVDGHLSIARQALTKTPPDGDTALTEARKALSIDAASVEAAAMVAFAYYHKKLYDTAELVLDDLYKRDSAKNNANVNYVYGLVYDKTNRPDRAVLAYQKAVSINPNHISALVNLGAHQLQQAQYDEAQRTFERLTRELNHSDAITLTSLGSAYRGRSAEYPAGTNDRDQFVRSAEGMYKRATSANPSYGPAYYNLGLLYLDNEPFPGVPDAVQRLNTAKAFFDQYKNMPGVDMKLYDDRMKDVTKALKRAQKKKKSSATP
ncbi:MAG: tetratricopeptide repeat protein [Kofleriaceae bacterium]|nr:tetratricopeptide repeat protein [Kofleriaceae bacterium]